MTDYQRSIQRAQQAQQREREEAARHVGRPVTDEGFVIPAAGLLIAVECPQCSYVSVGATEGQAVRSITAHISKKHHGRKES